MSRPFQALLPALTLLLLVGAGSPTRADCSAHPADLAPGVLGGGVPVPTWTIFGDGSVDVLDVLAILRTAVGLQRPVWSTPVSAGCPAVPGDLAPGTLNPAFMPPRWTPMPNGVVDVGDVLASLQLSVSLTRLDPAFVRPILASGQANDRVLTGTVRDSASSAAVPGVTVTAFLGKLPVGMTRTDAGGVFLLQNLPPGTLSVKLDGSTSTAAQGKFSSVQVQVDTAAEGATSLRGLSLPNEEDPDGAAGKFTGDESGTVEEEIDLSSESGQVGLATGPGGKVTVDDEPVSGDVDLSVVPLDGDELPGGLSDEDSGEDLNSTGEVAVGPAAGKFTGGGGSLTGLRAKGGLPPGFDLTLPNRKGLPIGTVVDIWYWDGEEGRWFDLSDLTGRSGMVVDLGEGATSVVAAGVATQGGLYAAALPVDPACTTRLTGRVVDGVGLPLAGVVVDSSLGSTVTTGPGGAFTFEMLPAYAGPGAGSCTGIGFDIIARGGVELGATSTRVMVQDVEVTPGGMLDVGDVVLTIPDEGCLSGLVLQNGEPLSGSVRVEGPDDAELVADEQGRFFRAGLTPGAYTSYFQFPSDAGERGFTFDIVARQCTTVRMEALRGTGSRRIEVLVLLDEDDDLLTPGRPVPGALVELRGSDAGSSEGLSAFTEQDGRAIFDGVSGPFSIVAQADLEPGPMLAIDGSAQFARLGAGIVTSGTSTGQVSLFLRPPQAWMAPASMPEGEVSGHLFHRPPTQANEAIGVASLRRGWLDPLTGGDFDPALGLYVAGGHVEPEFDLGVFVHSDGEAQAVSRVGLFGPFQLPDEPWAALEQDLDWSAVQPLVFDRWLRIITRNLQTASNSKSLRLLATGGEGRGFRAGLAGTLGGEALPERVLVPDPSSSSAHGWRLALDFDSSPGGPGGAGQSCWVPLAPQLQAHVDLNLLFVPQIQAAPGSGEATVEQVLGDPVTFTAVSPGVLPGFDLLSYEQPWRAAGPGEPSWTVFQHFLPAGSSHSASLGETASPFVFPGSELVIEVEMVRSLSLPASLSELFDQSLTERLAALPAGGKPVCSSRRSRVLEVVDDEE